VWLRKLAPWALAIVLAALLAGVGVGAWEVYYWYTDMIVGNADDLVCRLSPLCMGRAASVIMAARIVTALSVVLVMVAAIDAAIQVFRKASRTIT